MNGPLVRPDRAVAATTTQPRLQQIHGFMSPEECEHVIEIAQQHMQRLVTGNGTGSGTSINRFWDPVMTRIQRRISNIIMLPMQNNEDIQILNYAVDQEYPVHTDILPDFVIEDSIGWQRMATVLVYLNTVTAGGETVFPDGLWKDAGVFETEAVNEEKDARVSDCARGNVHGRPVAGEAAIFWSVDTSNVEDARSQHAGCPVVEGEKWAMNFWFHTTAFREMDYISNLKGYQRKIAQALEEAGLPTADAEPPDGAKCADRHEMCHDWALSDVCHHVPGVTSACCESCARFESGELK